MLVFVLSGFSAVELAAIRNDQYLKRLAGLNNERLRDSYWLNLSFTQRLRFWPGVVAQALFIMFLLVRWLRQ